MLPVHLGEEVPSIFVAMGNSSQSSSGHPIFLLTCLQKHFLRKATFAGFQIKCAQIDISEILETKDCNELCSAFLVVCGDVGRKGCR